MAVINYGSNASIQRFQRANVVSEKSIIGVIKSTIDRIDAVQDEALTIKVHLMGNGNLKSADILPYKFPENFEVFEPKITVKNSKSQSQIGGEKIIEYVVIPRSVGKIILEPFEIIFFDNMTKEWKTKRSKAIELSIAKNMKVCHSIIDQCCWTICLLQLLQIQMLQPLKEKLLVFGLHLLTLMTILY